MWIDMGLRMALSLVSIWSSGSSRSPQICSDDRDDHMETFRGDRDDRDRLDRRHQFYPDDWDDREWLQVIKCKHLSGDRDDRGNPNLFTFQDGGNNLTNHTKKWRSMDVFMTSFLFILKPSLSESIALRTPEEKFLFSSNFEVCTVARYGPSSSVFWNKCRTQNVPLCFRLVLLCLLRRRTLRISEKHAKNDV